MTKNNKDEFIIMKNEVLRDNGLAGCVIAKSEDLKCVFIRVNCLC